MTWLTRIQLDYETVARRKLRDNYAWHKAVWDAFPDRPDEQRSFLFRVDPKDHVQEVLLLSGHQPVRPDWCPPEAWSVKAVSAEFLTHRHYRFDMRVNATRCIKRFDSDGHRQKNGRRVVIADRDELGDWLDRKGEQGGFRVLDSPPLIVDPRTDHPFRKGDKTGLHVSVRLRGALEVIDSDRFRETFKNGIGSAKAFGFGMLLLQPV
jgi:CRISPR system Cascade subunit CasE